MNKVSVLLSVLTCGLLAAACGGSQNTANVNSAAPAKPVYKVVERPQEIKDQMAKRGGQDQAAPTLKIIEPAADATLTSSTVKVKLDIAGDLKGYMPHMDMETRTGNHIHVILDNQPYEAYYNLGEPFELRNVLDGEHTLRAFPSRPWHESYKNEGAFQMSKFTVKGGKADPNKPTTTNSGQTVANAKTPPTSEGKDVLPSNSGPVDMTRPLLTYSRPKGEYKLETSDKIMVDFWLTNAKLKGDGGEYRVRIKIDAADPIYLEKWEPVWLTGWAPGKAMLALELVDGNGNIIDNAGYNRTTRDITITK
ncbi:MAG: hypothetical protein KBD94_00555 [Pyrinomonadaceae bacterium]|nr:hypothetical protein [Pyrinomonadaceae bacterium]